VTQKPDAGEGSNCLASQNEGEPATSPEQARGGAESLLPVHSGRSVRGNRHGLKLWEKRQKQARRHRTMNFTCGVSTGPGASSGHILALAV
jgi:hypothetical protein